MATATADYQAPFYACVEAGGTKFHCELVDAQGRCVAQAVFPTLAPAQTLPQVVAFFRDLPERVVAMGIACFGPVELNPQSHAYGRITHTPKPGWANTDIAQYFARELDVPVAFDTDVNGALLGEQALGAARGCEHAVYITVGTGIGAGILVNGRLVQGLGHPEVGHMLLPRAPGDDFAGCCPFHGNCLEGMASGTALVKRWGDPRQLPVEHCAWDYQAFYLAALCVNLTHVFAPQSIIFGGGVMQQPHLLAKVRREFAGLINGYAAPAILARLEDYLQLTRLEGRAGVLGCWVMAKTLSHS